MDDLIEFDRLKMRVNQIEVSLHDMTQRFGAAESRIFTLEKTTDRALNVLESIDKRLDSLTGVLKEEVSGFRKFAYEIQGWKNRAIGAIAASAVFAAFLGYMFKIFADKFL